jgi:hypothetical protein
VEIVSILSPFVMVVAIVALAGHFAHRRNRMAHETVRAIIDKGVPTTPELVAQLRSKKWRDGDGRGPMGRLIFPFIRGDRTHQSLLPWCDDCVNLIDVAVLLWQKI